MTETVHLDPMQVRQALEEFARRDHGQYPPGTRLRAVVVGERAEVTVTYPTPEEERAAGMRALGGPAYFRHRGGGE